MKLAIRSDPQAYLRKQVKDGRYSHLSQAINSALEMARDQQILTPEDVAELQRDTARRVPYRFVVHPAVAASAPPAKWRSSRHGAGRAFLRDPPADRGRATA